MAADRLFGLLGSIVTLAMIAVAVGNGGKVAQIFTAGGKAFEGSINAATKPAR